jgi:hypothetical protein
MGRSASSRPSGVSHVPDQVASRHAKFDVGNRRRRVEVGIVVKFASVIENDEIVAAVAIGICSNRTSAGSRF